MAYEQRVRQFDLSGSLSAAIGPDTTSITAKGSAFTGLRTDLSTGLYIPMTIVDESKGTSEIVWGVSHSSASPTVGVIRAREGTTALSFDAGSVVRCAPTVRDVGLAVATRTALPTDPHIGLEVLIIDEGEIVRRTPGGWVGDSNIGDAKRKYLWTQSSAVLNSANAVVTGLAGTNPGSLASISNGVVTLNRGGKWSGEWHMFTEHASPGWAAAWLESTAFALQPFSKLNRNPQSLAGSGQLDNDVSFVRDLPAGTQITAKAGQINTGGTVISGVNYYLYLEYLGN